MEKIKQILLFAPLLGLMASGCSVYVGNGKGPQGSAGSDGSAGAKGDSGVDAYERYLTEHPEYSGDYDQWVYDLVNEELYDHSDDFEFMFSTDEEGNPFAILLEYYGENPIVKIPQYALGCPVRETRTLVVWTCNWITSLIFNDGMRFIREDQITLCDQLSTIYIPASVTEIAAWAFYGGADDLTIYCEAPSKPAGWDDDWYDLSATIVWGAEMPE